MIDRDDLLRGLEIRESAPDDFEALGNLYSAAFPDEDLLPLVKELLEDTPGVLSLVATISSTVVGHVIFTPCRTGERPEKAALLGPLAVGPDWQRSGIGTALIREGLQRLERDGFAGVFTLGDPGYYGRSGFAPEADVTPPYQLPEEWRAAWQSIRLNDARLRGPLEVAAPWRRPSLWAP